MARLRKSNRSGENSSGKKTISRSDGPSLEDCFTTGRVVLLFSLLTLIYTFPLVLNLDGWVMGEVREFSSDIFWYIWCFWSAKVQLLELGKSPLQFDLICGPFNQSSVFSLFKTHVIMIPVTALFNQVVALNVFVLANFILAGTFSWLMVHELTGSRTAGIVPAIAFAFSPYALTRALVHVDMAPVWVFPFMFYALCRSFRRFNRTGKLLLLLVLLFFYIFCSPYYYPLLPLGLGSWLLAWFINRYLFDFGLNKRIDGAFSQVTRRQWIAAGIAAVLLSAGALASYLFYLRPVAFKLIRPLLWQERFALRWTNYLLPGPDHPVFGPFTSKVLQREWGNTIESTVYLGWVLLLLAAYGIFQARARRDWRVWALILFGIAGYSITLGPYLRFIGLEIPMPSLLLHKLAPFIRSIGRYSTCVYVALTALAGFGMAKLFEERARSRQSQLAVLAMLTGLIAFEYAHPFALTQAPTRLEDGPAIYTRLAKKEPDATIFEYPAVTVTGMPIGEYYFLQTLHRRNLFNRYDNDTNIPEKFLPFWQDIDYPGALSDPVNLAGLKYFGVDYIVAHNREYTYWYHGAVPDIKQIDGLELTDDLGYERIYRLNVNPAKALIIFNTRTYHNYLRADLNLKNEGFDPPAVMGTSGEKALGWRPMTKKGSLEILNLTDSRQSVQLSMMGLSIEKPRRIGGKINGKSVGTISLNDTTPVNIVMQGIELAPGGKTLIELESLDSTVTIRSFGRNLEASAFMWKFDLQVADNDGSSQSAPN